jgi:putative transposase
VKYGFIREPAKRWPVLHQCRLLGGQRSTYYDWRDRPCKVIPAEELALRRRIKKALLIRALMMAVNLRKPPPGQIHYSDCGCQYASHAYQALLKQYGMICSMSRKGNCWDNTPIERFFSSLKREWTSDRLYRTRQEAIADVREYVAVYYNSKCLHSTLGYKTPMVYEKDLSKVSGIT